MASTYFLENGNVVVNLSAVFLCNTLADPDDVPAFLLLQLQVRVEHTEVELLEERKHIQAHLVTKLCFKIVT